MQTENFTAQWTRQQQFWASVDAQGQIIVADVTGARVVGVTVERMKHLEDVTRKATEKAEAYKKQLIDAGLLSIPLTPEQQIEKLTEQVAALTQLVTENIMGDKNGPRTNGNVLPAEASVRVDSTERVPGKPVQSQKHNGKS